MRGRLDLSVARAREAFSLIRAGALDGLSIGFRTLRAARDATSGGRRLLELDLVEISIVTFPALPQARIAAARPAPLDQKLARLRMQAAALRLDAQLRRLSRLRGGSRADAPPRPDAGDVGRRRACIQSERKAALRCHWN